MRNKTKITKKFISAMMLISVIYSVFIPGAHAYETTEINTHGGDQSNIAEDITIRSRLKELIFGREEQKKNKDIYLCPGGDAFGVKICGSGVTVSKVVVDGSEAFAENDRIIRINDRTVESISDVKRILAESNGDTLSVLVLRNGKRTNLKVDPLGSEGDYRLGVILSDGASGIGTVTYYDPKSGAFGGLGHGICSHESGELLGMTGGEATGVILAGAVKGEGGKPGELRGVLTSKSLGSVSCNTECGVFGKFNTEAIASIDKNGERIPLPIARRAEVECGEATILATIKSGKRAEYSIKIEDIDRDSTGTKSFRIKVTDPTLIALTGGIVRGMSGSPIIQNGKLVGAVTHVMVANPTEGYGIFIENMLSAAQNQTIPKVA